MVVGLVGVGGGVRGDGNPPVVHPTSSTRQKTSVLPRLKERLTIMVSFPLRQPARRLIGSTWWSALKPLERRIAFFSHFKPKRIGKMPTIRRSTSRGTN